MHGLTKRYTLSLAALLALVALPSTSCSQTTVEPASRTNLYDSISVLRSDPATEGSGFRVRPNNNLEAVNTTLIDIIAFAYNVHPKRIVNAPAWAGQTLFDLKMHYRGGGSPDDAACKAMLKQALTERFGLVAHSGGESLPGYAIHVEPAGPKLAGSMAMPGSLPALAMPKPGTLTVHNATLADFATMLQRAVLDRPVVDETGIKGRWDFELSWAPAPSEYSGRYAKSAPVAGKDLAETMRRELGLRLDPVTAQPSDVVLDRIQIPTGT
ncbi:Protein of unknown function (DUF3738) [Terriglobus roseus DSM 18391]|uniref:Soil-associated protein, TIGR03435 family n=1 Tax=Terriglobus roseus (strain DSM 18391 / NRRL B-41598 / KBS 63) TaxID=926566 RepID=I3ZBM6_TERRK|nr:TIGR03435 family protein [Terriglobus roseus]AFL86644.1 Protein of unknown function (DUF3738) [Terriglobus roseus DSM 18391]